MKRLKFGIIISFIVFAIFTTVSLVGAQENNPYQENVELKQLVDTFGNSSLDISISVEGHANWLFSDVKMIRPVTLFNNHFFRVKDKSGQIILINPKMVASIKIK